MNKFRKNARAKAAISTASLPDIVFLLLFYFMVTTTIKTSDELVNVSIPKAHFLTKTEQKILVKELYIGVPDDASFGNQPKISTGERFIETYQLVDWVLAEKSKLPEHYKDKMIVVLEADKDVEMGLISDIQEQLRKANARKVFYKSSEKALLN